MSTLWSGCVHRCVPKAAALSLVRAGARRASKGGRVFRSAPLGLRSCLGSASHLAFQMRGPNLWATREARYGPARASSQTAPGKAAAALGLTASLRRRGLPHAPAAPPAPHSMSKITHTCAGKQARQPPPGLRVLAELQQRAPTARTCRQAPPTGCCATGPRPARQAPPPPARPRPSPSLPGPGVLAPGVLAGWPRRGSASLSPPWSVPHAQVRSLPSFPLPHALLL